MVFPPSWDELERRLRDRRTDDDDAIARRLDARPRGSRPRCRSTTTSIRNAERAAAVAHGDRDRARRARAREPDRRGGQLREPLGPPRQGPRVQPGRRSRHGPARVRLLGRDASRTEAQVGRAVSRPSARGREPDRRPSPRRPEHRDRPPARHRRGHAHHARRRSESIFGSEIATLVDGVTKIGQINFKSRAESQAENFRKMIIAMARDIRVILIKLADRTHNMRTLVASASPSARPRSRRRRSTSTRRSRTGSASTG